MSARAFEFYAQLEADNSKTFWTANRDVYDQQVREPLAQLLDALRPEFGEAKLFRPYRDTRFSHDKTPYKTHQGAFTGQSSGIGYYLQLDADGVVAGGGFRSHSPDQVARYRRSVDDDVVGAQLDAIMRALRADGAQVRGDEVKTRPRGVPADHPRLDLMRCRSLMVSTRIAPEQAATPAVLDDVRSRWRALRPLADWAEQYVGPPDP
jgi:uncharacterized protein (TIGR02453 family)